MQANPSSIDICTNQQKKYLLPKSASKSIYYPHLAHNVTFDIPIPKKLLPKSVGKAIYI